MEKYSKLRIKNRVSSRRNKAASGISAKERIDITFGSMLDSGGVDTFNDFPEEYINDDGEFSFQAKGDTLVIEFFATDMDESKSAFFEDPALDGVLGTASRAKIEADLTKLIDGKSSKFANAVEEILNGYGDGSFFEGKAKGQVNEVEVTSCNLKLSTKDGVYAEFTELDSSVQGNDSLISALSKEIGMNIDPDDGDLYFDASLHAFVCTVEVQFKETDKALFTGSATASNKAFVARKKVLLARKEAMARRKASLSNTAGDTPANVDEIEKAFADLIGKYKSQGYQIKEFTRGKSYTYATVLCPDGDTDKHGYWEPTTDIGLKLRDDMDKLAFKFKEIDYLDFPTEHADGSFGLSIEF